MANTVNIYLTTPEPPPTCEKCPLIGIIPKDKRVRGLRQSFCCLGVWPYEPLTSKGIGVNVKDKREKTGHFRRRVCDDKWDVWYTDNAYHTVKISKDAYKYCRLPYEGRKQLEFNFRKPRK